MTTARSRTRPARSGGARPPAGPPRRALLLGLGLMTLGMLTIPMVDGLAKFLSAGHSPLFVAWARYAAACLVVLPVALLVHGRQPLPRRDLGPHFLRTLFLMAAMTLYFLAIATIPLATAISAFFVAPILATPAGGAGAGRAADPAQARGAAAGRPRRAADPAPRRRPGAGHPVGHGGRRLLLALPGGDAPGRAQQPAGAHPGLPVPGRRRAVDAPGALGLVAAQRRRALAVPADGRPSRPAVTCCRSAPSATPRPRPWHRWSTWSWSAAP